MHVELDPETLAFRSSLVVIESQALFPFEPRLSLSQGSKSSLLR
jgi:hypothetical protein